MKYNIGSIQINNGFSGQYYLPYSIGTLEAYFLKFSKNPERYNFQTTIYKRLLLNDCLHKLYKDDIILFSVYVWNKNISIEIAKELKKINKNKFIVFGGPSAPDNAENFLRKNDFVDDSSFVSFIEEQTILELSKVTFSPRGIPTAFAADFVVNDVSVPSGLVAEVVLTFAFIAAIVYFG